MREQILKIPAPRFGIAEWFGKSVHRCSADELSTLVKQSRLTVSQVAADCPFIVATDISTRCNKKGGVCSIRRYESHGDDQDVGLGVGDFVSTCPRRLWEANLAFCRVGETLVGSAHPIVVREVDFLETIKSSPSEEEADSVGRIDAVLVNPEDPTRWCALEFQAVYFSGSKMETHFDQFAGRNGSNLPFPDSARRPDFRSSGPKRLMPQLQVKVPTLRRWGKKMAVVVDRPFFESMGAFTRVPHLSNCDIVWFVGDYDRELGKLVDFEAVYTTLESSIEALTAGVPRSLEEFEGDIQNILNSKKKSDQKKVLRIA